MNSLQLLCALKSQKVNVKVISVDQLPYRVKTYPRGFIVNNETSKQKGKHWIALWIESPDYGEFFDSFGEKPIYYGKRFTDFLNRNVKRYISNTEQLQNDSSDTCGLFTLFYILLKTRGYSMKRIRKRFTEDTRLNDHILYQFAHRYFNRCI